MDGAAAGAGGIRTELLSDERYAETGSGERVVRQNSRMLKVVLGEDLLARQGSMVAFQGAVDFDYEGSGGAGKFLKKALTGEGLPLMRCTGQGELFLADAGKQGLVISPVNGIDMQALIGKIANSPKSVTTVAKKIFGKRKKRKGKKKKKS